MSTCGTTQETLEVNCFSTQTLSGNCLHVDVASANKCLKTDSVVDGTANHEVSKHPWLDSVCACNNMVFQFSQIGMVFMPINSIEEGCTARGDACRRTIRRCRGTGRSRSTRRRRNRGTRRRRNR